MPAEDDRELFFLFCRGLLETFCSEVTFTGSRFGVTASQVPSRGTGPCIVLDFSEAEFDRAVTVSGESAEGLWPDRPPRQRAVQLMLVHADEEITTTRGPADAYVLTLPDGFVSVCSSGPTSRVADEQALEEQQRIARVIEDGRRKGHTFEWR
jgi:hypothetical protein